MKSSGHVWLVVTIPGYEDSTSFAKAFADERQAQDFCDICNRYNEGYAKYPVKSDYRTHAAYVKAFGKQQRKLERWRAKHPAGKDFCYSTEDFMVVKVPFVPLPEPPKD